VDLSFYTTRKLKLYLLQRRPASGGPQLLHSKDTQALPSSEKTYLIWTSTLHNTDTQALPSSEKACLIWTSPSHNKDTQALPTSEETCPRWTSAFTQQGHSSFTFFREDLLDVWTSPSHNKDTKAFPTSGRPA
jgi:hypothetical protein